uniref:Transposase (putative) gypsy type domain-containing protein n=1 Tax=Aegilops tauschii subsp. strangulata TaxID=200361 RepID=A0A453QW30_AEGTS
RCAMAYSWNSASWSPDDLDEPSRDGGNDHVSVPHERVTSRLRNRGTLEKICKKYSIPDSFTPIAAGDLSMWSPPPPGSVCVYVESLSIGMRLPLHPFFGTVLSHFGLAPSQLAPNGWRALAGFVVLSHLAGVEPSLAVFRHFFAVCLCKPHIFYSFRGKDAAGLLFARVNCKIRGWNLEGGVLLLGVIGAMAVPGGVGGAFQVLRHGSGPHRRGEGRGGDPHVCSREFSD